MSTKKTTDEEEARKRQAAELLRARALRRFGKVVLSAIAEYETELQRNAGKDAFSGVLVRDVPRGDDERMATAIAGWLGHAFAAAGSGERFELGHDDRQTLRRLYKGLRPHVDARTNGEALELGEAIVREHAEAFAEAVPGAPHPGYHPAFGVKQGDPATMLVLALTTQVHPGFKALRREEAEVRALLSRFTAGKGRKPKKGQPSKLSAAGILVALNELAGGRRPCASMPTASASHVLDRSDGSM